MNLIERLRRTGDDLAGFDGSGGLYHEAADRIAELERINQQLLVAANHHADNAKELEAALHEISLCSTNSMSSKEECGRIARQALEQKDGS